MTDRNLDPDDGSYQPEFSHQSSSMGLSIAPYIPRSTSNSLQSIRGSTRTFVPPPPPPPPLPSQAIQPPPHYSHPQTTGYRYQPQSQTQYQPPSTHPHHHELTSFSNAATTFSPQIDQQQQTPTLSSSNREFQFPGPTTSSFTTVGTKHQTALRYVTSSGMRPSLVEEEDSQEVVEQVREEKRRRNAESSQRHRDKRRQISRERQARLDYLERRIFQLEGELEMERRSASGLVGSGTGSGTGSGVTGKLEGEIVERLRAEVGELREENGRLREKIGVLEEEKGLGSGSEGMSSQSNRDSLTSNPSSYNSPPFPSSDQLMTDPSPPFLSRSLHSAEGFSYPSIYQSQNRYPITNLAPVPPPHHLTPHHSSQTLDSLGNHS